MAKERKVYHCPYCEDTRPQKRSKTCGKQQCINKHFEASMKTVCCIICETSFKVKQNVSDARYCSEACRSKRHEKNCEYCEKPFRTLKNYQRFCSHKCARQHDSEQMVTLECDYCGEEFDRSVLGVSDTYLHNFCSKVCRNRHYTQLYYPQERKYGSDWYTIRKEVLDYYNNTCQGCGFKPSKEENIHVHHVIPRKYTEIPINSLETLLPLCEECHKKAHRDHDDWFKEAFGDEDIV